MKRRIPYIPTNEDYAAASAMRLPEDVQAREDAAWLAAHPVDFTIHDFIGTPKKKEEGNEKGKEEGKDKRKEEGKDKRKVESVPKLPPAPACTLTKEEKTAAVIGEAKKLRETFGVMMGIFEEKMQTLCSEAHALGAGCPFEPCGGCLVPDCPYGRGEKILR